MLRFTPRLMSHERRPDLAVIGDALRVARIGVAF
jgi:hypothetical protein